VGQVVPRQELEDAVGEEIGDEAERQVDPENERPVQIFGEEAAESGSGDR